MNDNSIRTVQLDNPNLPGKDYLYHFGLTTDHDLKERFNDVKFLCMGGKPSRMANFAEFMYEELGKPQNSEFETEEATVSDKKLKNISESAGRYCMFKVGPVLSASHGIGSASMSVALNELLKLLYYAECNDVTVIRIGTSGGLGIEPGTVVITHQAYNSLLQPRFRQVICGKETFYNSSAHLDVVEAIRKSAESLNINSRVGNTMAADDFYEEQGRLDGAFCNYTEQDKMDFLQRAFREHEILNMEMESACWLAMCNRAKVKAAVVCVTLVNRLLGDQVTDNSALIKEWELHPQKVVAEFIKKKLHE